MDPLLPPPTLEDALTAAGVLCHFIAGSPELAARFARWAEHHDGDLDAALGSVRSMVAVSRPPAEYPSLMHAFIAAADQIRQNREMVRLDDDLPLPKPIDALKIKPDYPALIADLEQCEFRGLLAEYRAEAARVGETKSKKPGTEQTEMFPF